MWKTIPRAALVEIPASGHAVMLDNCPTLVDAVREFAADLFEVQ